MVSGGAYSQRVVEAHISGDLHVHEFAKKGGCWASWDCAAIAGEGDNIEHLVSFVARAKHEWPGFQRLSGFESLAGTCDPVELLRGLVKCNLDFVEGKTGKILLGFEEQDREEGDVIFPVIFESLRTSATQTGDLTPVIMFTDAYKWGTNGDLPLYEPANALCSPIFMHRKEATTRKAVDPWLDGASPGVNTGVLGAVTINIPRVAFTSGDESEFFDRVWDLTGVAVEGLETKRSHLDEMLKAEEMPATHSIIESFDDFFGAVSFVGMNEALINLVSRGIGSMQGKVVAYKVLEAMQDRLEEKDKETGHRFCLMAEPTDGAAYRLAELDQVKYPEIKAAGVGAPFYTKSTCLPVDYTEDLWDALEHQKKLQTLYNGGTIFNIHPGKEISDVEGCKTLVRKLVEKTPLPCFAFSPSVNVGGAERYERTGYWYKPVSGMVAGEVEEVGLRRPFAVQSGW